MVQLDAFKVHPRTAKAVDTCGLNGVSQRRFSRDADPLCMPALE